MSEIQPRQKVNVGDALINVEIDARIRDENVVIRQQLVYLGHNGFSFRLGYRELSNGTLRSSFSENAVYQNPSHPGPVEVRFRSAVLHVYAVSNAEIEFVAEHEGEI